MADEVRSPRCLGEHAVQIPLCARMRNDPIGEASTGAVGNDVIDASGVGSVTPQPNS